MKQKHIRRILIAVVTVIVDMVIDVAKGKRPKHD